MALVTITSEDEDVPPLSLQVTEEQARSITEALWSDDESVSVPRTLLQELLSSIQSGNWRENQPTLETLQLAGRLHGILER